MSKPLKTVLIFIFTLGSTAGVFYGIPFLTAQPKLHMAAILFGGGLVLAVVLSVIACAGAKTAKAEEKKPETAPREEKAPFNAHAVQVLSLLQKQGRFIDFLQEDISGYEDSQVGAAVRNIHKGCREAVFEHINIEPVIKEPEGSDVGVEEGFDPSAIRITGNVVGPPPFKGVLRHNGWRVSTTDMPPLPKNQDLSIIEPAEVEIA